LTGVEESTRAIASPTGTSIDHVVDLRVDHGSAAGAGLPSALASPARPASPLAFATNARAEGPHLDRHTDRAVPQATAWYLLPGSVGVICKAHQGVGSPPHRQVADQGMEPGLRPWPFARAWASPSMFPQGFGVSTTKLDQCPPEGGRRLPSQDCVPWRGGQSRHLPSDAPQAWEPCPQAAPPTMGAETGPGCP